MPRFLPSLLPLLFAILGGNLHAQQPEHDDALRAMLTVSQRRSELVGEKASPFHLIATVERYGPDGKVISKGKLDELWQDARHYRQGILVPPANSKDAVQTLLEVDNGTQAWRTGSWSLPGSFVDPVVRPFWLFERMEHRLSRQEAPTGAATLDCVGTEPVLPSVDADVPLAIHIYCMDRGSHLLRFMSAPNGLQISYREVQPFEGKYIARTVEIAVNGQMRFRVHIDSLDAPTDFSALEQPAPEGAQLLKFHRADFPVGTSELFRGQLLKGAPPLFPKPGGTVVVKVHINERGEVEAADVVETSNRMLGDAAVAAAKQFKFRAAYQNTKPVPMDGLVRLGSDGGPVFFDQTPRP